MDDQTTTNHRPGAPGRQPRELTGRRRTTRSSATRNAKTSGVAGGLVAALVILALVGCQWQPFTRTKDGHPFPGWYCGDIHYAIVAGTPGEEADIRAVAGEIGALTGRRLIYDGRVSEFKPTHGQVRVTFDNAAIDNGPAQLKEAAGWGGPLFDGFAGFDGGVIALRPLAPSAVGLRKRFLRHEWGHIIGLSHVNDSSEIMNTYPVVEDWGTGDRDGLHTMGQLYCKDPKAAEAGDGGPSAGLTSEHGGLIWNAEEGPVAFDTNT